MACFVIAECGVNHSSDINVAKRLIDAAKEAGADAAKFQYFSSRKLWGDDRIKHLELRFSEMVLLHGYCEQVGIEFMATPFGVEEVVLLRQLLKRWKVASGCLTRTPILAAMRETGMPVILSTGMSNIPEIVEAMALLRPLPITVLHCTSAYPCPVDQVNLKAIGMMRAILDVPVGYSDHTPGITIAIAAAAKGATVIEKHLTLDCNADGPDHKASIEPHDFRAMVRAIRDVEAALGDGCKRVMESEQELRTAWRDFQRASGGVTSRADMR